MIHLSFQTGVISEKEIISFIGLVIWNIWCLVNFAAPPAKEKYRVLLTIRKPKNRLEKLFVCRDIRQINYDSDLGKLVEEYYQFGLIIFAIWVLTLILIIVVFPFDQDYIRMFYLVDLVATLVLMLTRHFLIHYVLKLFNHFARK